MVTGALVAAQVIVAVALLVSGFSKIRTHSETVRAMRDLKVPFPALHHVAARALPWLEIALGASLLALPGAAFQTAAWIAVATLLVFTLLLAAALARHDDVDCNCFGELGASGGAITGWTIARNSVLLALAASSALFLHSGAIIQATQFTAFELGWFLLLILNTISLVVIANSVARKRTMEASSVDAPPVDQSQPDGAIPNTEFVSAAGEVVPFKKLWNGRAAVVFFIKMNCSPCAEITARLPEWKLALDASVDIRVVTSTSQSKFRVGYPELADDALYGSLSTRKALGITGHPAAILLGQDGSITGPALGSDDVIEFLAAISAAVVAAPTIAPAAIELN